jgi:hypothetical protein
MPNIDNEIEKNIARTEVYISKKHFTLAIISDLTTIKLILEKNEENINKILENQEQILGNTKQKPNFIQKIINKLTKKQ